MKDPETDEPLTGWASLESLEKDYWKQHKPDLVLIPALEFCEKPEGFKKSAWYPPMMTDTYLMGLRMVKADKQKFEHQESLEYDFEEAESIKSKPKTENSEKKAGRK